MKNIVFETNIRNVNNKMVSNKKWQARVGAKLDIHASSNKKLKNYITNMVRVVLKKD